MSMVKTLYFLIIIGIMFASCFVLPDSHAQDCMGGQFCGGNTSYFAPTLNRNVTVSLSFHSNSTMSDNVHYLWLRFFDAKNNELIKNVSFFINATKDGKVLMHELFYTKTGLMLMKFYPSHDMERLIINGTSEPTLGGWMSKNDTLPITTSVFAENGIYHIHLEVLALDYVNEIADQNNAPTFDSWWSVDDRRNISKYENHTIGTSLQLENNTIANKIESPLKQFKSGIAANNVKCKQGFDLMIKTHDNMPVCVRPETAQTLIMRGWGTVPLPIDNADDQKMNGTISGRVVLAGGPIAGPQANYEVDVYATDGVTIVGKTFSDNDGNYSIPLLAGNYTIYTKDYPTKQIHLVSVYHYKNTVFNIVYGIGYK